MDLKDAIYGRCPNCGARGRFRERRLDGNDECENGCVYKSSDAVITPECFGAIPEKKIEGE